MSADSIAPITRSSRSEFRMAWPREFARKHGADLRIAGVFAVLAIVLSVSSRNFTSVGNLLNLMDQAVVVGIVALGQTFVILVAGIDLSVGAIVGLAGIIIGLSMTQANLPLPIALAVGLLSGMIFGLFNGLLVTKGRLAAFIVTLGAMSIGRSMAFVISDGNPISTLPDSFELIASGAIFKMPVNFLVLVSLFILAGYYLKATKGGRTIYAIGSNPEAARAAGLKVNYYVTLAYVISGLMAGIASILLSSRLMTIDPNAGTGLELDAIAAAVIGGASLFGGRGSVVGTFFGTLIMVLIRNGLNLLNVGPYWQGSAIGAVIIIAVLIERITSGRSAGQVS
jgi:ribose transport system permease protein